MGSLSSPSTSISTTSSPKLISEKCLVCDQPSHGNHFGVDSCRACAAFFRRVFVTHKQQYKCINELEQCVPDARGRWKCRKCRTDRCFELGMRPDSENIFIFKFNIGFIQIFSTIETCFPVQENFQNKLFTSQLESFHQNQNALRISTFHLYLNQSRTFYQRLELFNFVFKYDCFRQHLNVFHFNVRLLFNVLHLD